LAVATRRRIASCKTTAPRPSRRLHPCAPQMTAMEHQPSPGLDDRQGSSSDPQGAQAIEFTPLLNGRRGSPQYGKPAVGGLRDGGASSRANCAHPRSRDRGFESPLLRRRVHPCDREERQAQRPQPAAATLTFDPITVVPRQSLLACTSSPNRSPRSSNPRKSPPLPHQNLSRRRPRRQQARRVPDLLAVAQAGTLLSASREAFLRSNGTGWAQGCSRKCAPQEQ